ncbi:hypothetical protein DUI87_06654 [Hirundo rustica rustica]|uniref:SKA complex subunit 1 n=1 Tax=Hirundo rustica rustica TaxID=333673 RepID=A0A3M0LAP9_HIRRU|nr:hypothetical protein DUI87_06654 [Hirundo rustica rustica]
MQSKPAKETKVIKEAALITTKEFEDIPKYLKGRITYDQVNAVVQQMNKAVVDKYKILYQPLKSMKAPVRNLYHRFVEQENKDTKGFPLVLSLGGLPADLFSDFKMREGAAWFIRVTSSHSGVFFIVEADIKEFTQLKVDKRFHSILSILRHCKRVREVRGSGLIRYVIC